MSERRPRQSETLVRIFSDAFDDGTIWQVLSDGLLACLENARSLRDDFQALVTAERFPAAQFMYVTCMEEVGKAVILFDVARIDPRAGFLPRLCKAFYSHSAKYAYARVMASPGRGDMAAALESYRVEAQEYWHNANPEDGDPDTLAAGLYARESALYVDYVEPDSGWFRPHASALTRLYADPSFMNASGTTSGEREIEAALRPLEVSEAESLFCPASLAIVGKEFSGFFCNARCDAQVGAILGRIARLLQESEVEVSSETYWANFIRLPLYAAVVAPERIPPFR